MKGLYLNDSEARVAIAALQTLERSLSVSLEATALADDPERVGGKGLPPKVSMSLDLHDAVSALIVQLATAGPHWVDRRGIDMAEEGLHRYVNLLTDSVEHIEIAEDDYLLDRELRDRQMELSQSSALLQRLEKSLRYGVDS